MKDYMIHTFVVLLLILFISGTYFIATYFEMKAFNKFSHTKATFVDAMFTNLRVIPD